MSATLKSGSGTPPLHQERRSRDGSATLAGPTGRKKLAQGKERDDALGHKSHNTSSTEELKDGGVPRDGWRTAPFGEVVEILDSRRIPVNSEERAKRVGDVPYYGATGQVGFIDKHIFDEELVLLGEDGAPFLESGKPKAYLIRGKSWVNNHAHVLRGRPGLLNSFLLYQLNNLDYRPYVSGTTRLKLPQGPMKQIPLLVPLEDEQRRIVEEIEKQFTRLDAGVAALRRVQANLKRYRDAVLKAACEGQLVPTEAELAKVKVQSGSGVPPLKQSRDGSATLSATFETGEQLLQRILGERRKNWTGRGKYKEPAASDTGGLQPLPQGWTWATADQLASKITDGEHLSPVVRPTGVPLLSAKDVRAFGVIFDDAKYVSTQDSIRFRERCAPNRGDILIVSRGATIGRSCLVNTDQLFCLMGSVILMKADALTSAPFLLAVLKSVSSVKRLIAASGSTAQQAVYIRDIRSLPIPLPPLAEQSRITAEVERRLSVVEELEAVVSANLLRATRLRQSILRKAFTGDLS